MWLFMITHLGNLWPLNPRGVGPRPTRRAGILHLLTPAEHSIMATAIQMALLSLSTREREGPRGMATVAIGKMTVAGNIIKINVRGLQLSANGITGVLSVQDGTIVKPIVRSARNHLVGLLQQQHQLPMIRNNFLKGPL